MPKYKIPFLTPSTLAGLPSPVGLLTGTAFEITDYGGNIATVVNGVWRFEYPFRTTWAGRPAVDLVPAGTELQVTDYKHQKWISDGTYWRPAQGHAQIYVKWGALSSPLAVIQNSTSSVFSLAGGAPKIPAEMIIPNSKLNVQVDLRKVGGAASATANIYLGVLGTVSDPAITGMSITAGANADMMFSGSARFGSSKISYNTRAWYGEGNSSGSSSGAMADRTPANTDADMFVTIGIGVASASDTFNLVGCSLVLEA